MSTGFWGPFYVKILHAAMQAGVERNACEDKHRFDLQTYERNLVLPQALIDEFTYEVVTRPNDRIDLQLNSHSWDAWSHGIWAEAVHVALLHYCWHLTLPQAFQSLCRLEIKGMIRRDPPITRPGGGLDMRYNPLQYDDCEPWPRWLPVEPLQALAGI